MWIPKMTLQWRHDGCNYVSNHQPHDRLLNRLFRRRSKKTSKLRVTGLCAGNSPGTGEFPAQMASNAENVSIWWRHHDKSALLQRTCNKSQPMLTQNHANELDESHLDVTKPDCLSHGNYPQAMSSQLTVRVIHKYGSHLRTCQMIRTRNVTSCRFHKTEQSNKKLESRWSYFATTTQKLSMIASLYACTGRQYGTTALCVYVS